MQTIALFWVWDLRLILILLLTALWVGVLLALVMLLRRRRARRRSAAASAARGANSRSETVSVAAAEAEAGPALVATGPPRSGAPSTLQRIPLRPAGLTLGRAADNDVAIDQRIDGWETVSRHHARLRLSDGYWFFEDLDSRNGSYINGRRTGHNLLEDGWELRLGAAAFTFHERPSEVPDPAPSTQPLVQSTEGDYSSEPRIGFQAGAAAGSDDVTGPLVRLDNGFEVLPEGAILRGRYAVLEIRGANQNHHVYLAEDLAPMRQCANCGGVTSGSEERFCGHCGTELTGSSPIHRRYLVQERAGENAFASERRLLAMALQHPGLLLPLAVFSEVPYGSERTYRVMPELSISLVKAVAVPQPLTTVLAWGVSLAKAMAYLHQHQVIMGSVDLEHIAADGKRAMWTGLNRTEVIPPEERAKAGVILGEEVRRLAMVLAYLATGKQRFEVPVTQIGEPGWPEELRLLMSDAGQPSTTLSAAQFAAGLERVLASLRQPERARLATGSRTEVGSVRSLNEDSLLTLDLSRALGDAGAMGGLYVVADGMGGHAAGDVASQLTVRTMARLATEELLSPGIDEVTYSDSAMWLEQAVKGANQAVYQARKSANSDMGTTLVAALVFGVRATLANVGDSRCYHLSPEGIRRITVDHSLVERLVSIGQITREEAATHPQRNVIYRVIGDKPEVEVDIYVQHLRPAEALLLCSDGLSGMVSEQSIWQLWLHAGTPQDACDRMVAAADQAGGEDNISAIIVEVIG